MRPRGHTEEREKPLVGLRIIAALNGLELFGHERGNIEVYKAIRRLGAAVTVGVNATENGGDVGRHLRELDFPTVPLPFGNQWSLKWLKQDPMSLVSKVRSVVRCSFEFRRIISEIRPTHILLGSPLAYSYLSLALAACKVPMTYRLGDCPPFASGFNMRIWHLAMRRTTHAVAISEFVQREAISGGLPTGRVSVIYNLAPSSVERSESRKVESMAAREVFRRIVYVGAVAEHKGVKQLVQAFALLRRSLPDLVLDVVGGSRYDAQFRGEVKRLVDEAGLKSCVVMHGQQADPIPFYRRAHVHVAPSLCEEALGNVVLEAKREGVPSVVFRSGGLPELIRSGVDGVICEEKTPEALAAGIASLLDNEDRRRVAGRAAREDFEARFGPERFARQWAEVFLRPSSVSRRDDTGPASERS